MGYCMREAKCKLLGGATRLQRFQEHGAQGIKVFGAGICMVLIPHGWKKLELRW